MRVLLLNPPHIAIGSRIPLEQLPPLGLLSIGGPLIDAGHDVELLDAEVGPLTHDEVIKRVVAHRPQVLMIGHSGSTSAPGMIAVMFDAKPYLARKFSALAAHRSAFGVTQEMLRDPPPEVAGMLSAFRPVFEREVFLLGGPRIGTATWPLQDFFDGVI